MAKQVLYRRGTTAEHATFTGANGEITVDTVKHVVVVHDGLTVGGIPLANASAVNASISTLTANAANQAASIIALTSNAATQATAITALQANAVAQQSGIDAFIQASNATVIFANIADVRANLLAAHSNIALLTGYNTVRQEEIAALAVNVSTAITQIAAINAVSPSTLATTANISAGNLVLDFGYGWTTVNLNQSVTSLTFVNPPVTGNVGSLTVEFVQYSSTTHTIDNTNYLTASGAGLDISALPGSISLVTFVTKDGGSTYFGFSSGKDWA